jgi:hypothetical protein
MWHQLDLSCAPCLRCCSFLVVMQSEGNELDDDDDIDEEEDHGNGANQQDGNPVEYDAAAGDMGVGAVAGNSGAGDGNGDVVMGSGREDADAAPGAGRNVLELTVHHQQQQQQQQQSDQQLGDLSERQEQAAAAGAATAGVRGCCGAVPPTMAMAKVKAAQGGDSAMAGGSAVASDKPRSCPKRCPQVCM